MMFYYIDGTDRSSDVTANTLRINSQLQQRSGNCSFEVNAGDAPTVNTDLKVYDGDKAASQSSTTLVLQGKFQTGVSKFYTGQVLWVRIGQANAEKVIVASYDEATLTITLETAPVVAVVNGDQVGELVFGGIVAKTSDKNLHSLANLLWDVQGVDYTKIFDKKIVGDSWASVDARYIINSLFNSTVNYNQTIDTLSYANDAAIQAVWIEANDGLNPTVDTATYLEDTSSGVFAWTHSAGTAKWTATISSVDVSTLTGAASGTPTKGSLMLWCDAADLTKFSTIKLRIGSSSVNYAEVTLTPTVEGDFAYLRGNLASGTVTGTPNWSAVVHAAIIITETASSSVKLNGFRLNDDSAFSCFGLTSTPLIDDFRAQQVKPTQIVNDLAKAYEYVWYIDYERDIHFASAETLLAPQDITDVTDNFYNLSISVDTSQVGNRIIINGGKTLSSSRYSQVFPGDNVQRGWIVKSPFDSMVVKIDDGTSTHAAAVGTTTTNIKIVGHGLSVDDWVINRTRSNATRQVTAVVDADNFTVQTVTAQTNGDNITFFATTKTVAIEGVGDETAYDYMGNSDNQSVRASTQTSTLPATSFIQFSYYEIIPIQLRYSDPVSVAALKALGLGDGVFDLATVTDATIQDATSALILAQAKVLEYANPIVTGTFKTDQRGFRAGQLITINQVTGRGFAGTYVIQKVAMAQSEGEFQDYATYVVTFSTTLFGWVELMQKLLRNGVGATDTSNETVETFVSASEEAIASDTNSVAVGGGFLSAANTETPTASDTNTVEIFTPPWHWETSSGQPLTTRWNLFSWN